MSMILVNYLKAENNRTVGRTERSSTLNRLFTDTLESHAPRRRVKLTRPFASCMKNPTIVSDHQRLELSRIKSRDSKNPKEHQK